MIEIVSVENVALEISLVVSNLRHCSGKFKPPIEV